MSSDDPFGQEDVATISAVHNAAGKIDSSPCNICSIVYVANFIDRAAMDTHSKLQLRILFQFLADFDRAAHRYFRAVEKNERHAVARGKPNQFSFFFCSANLVGTTDDFGQLFAGIDAAHREAWLNNQPGP